MSLLPYAVTVMAGLCIVSALIVIGLRGFLLRAGLFRMAGVAIVYAAVYYFAIMFAPSSTPAGLPDLMPICVMLGVLAATGLKWCVQLTPPKRKK